VPGVDDDAVAGQHPTGAQSGHPSLFVDPGAFALDDAGKSHGEAERMDAGAVRVEGGAPESFSGKAIGRGWGVEPGGPRAPVLGVLGLRPTSRGLRPTSRGLRPAAGNDQRPARVKPALDPFRCDHPADLVDGFAQCRVLIPGRGLTVVTSQGPGATGDRAETQPPLRPLAPKPTCSASRTSTLSDGSASSR